MFVWSKGFKFQFSLVLPRSFDFKGGGGIAIWISHCGLYVFASASPPVSFLLLYIIVKWNNGSANCWTFLWGPLCHIVYDVFIKCRVLSAFVWGLSFWDSFTFYFFSIFKAFRFAFFKDFSRTLIAGTGLHNCTWRRKKACILLMRCM